MFHPDGRGLSVYVFKSLTIEYNGRPVNTHRGSTKVIQLLLLLLLSGGDGVPKHALVSAIYGQEEEGWADYNQYVNNLIYRLKKLLTEWEMDGATVEISRSICYFRADFPVTVDALEFRRKSLEALASEDDGRLAALEEAFQMYTDTFLEEFSTDLWVIQRKREIRKLYFRVTEALGEGYRASGSLNRARNIYHQAAVWFPFESFRLHEMDCLIGLNDYEGAYALYTDIRQSYAGAMEVMPEREIQKRLAIVEKRLGHSARTLPEIVALLRTNARTGAFYCHYAVFVSFCQILARLAERSGRPLSLMLCTWTDGGGYRNRALTGQSSRCPFSGP